MTYTPAIGEPVKFVVHEFEGKKVNGAMYYRASNTVAHMRNFSQDTHISL